MTRSIMLLAGLLLTGCGVQPTGVQDAGKAPTGVAPGPTLYFLDARGDLVPDVRQTGRLGTISDAVSLLLTGPGDSPLRTDIRPTAITRVNVTLVDNVIRLQLPLAAGDVTGHGADQIVCTALAAHVQSGGSRDATVQLLLTIPGPASDAPRTCPATD